MKTELRRRSEARESIDRREEVEPRRSNMGREALRDRQGVGAGDRATVHCAMAGTGRSTIGAGLPMGGQQ